jgi:hypothetical protein
MAQLRFSELSAPRQEFIRQCQRMGFGRIESLDVSDCEPVFGPQTRSLVDVKLDTDEVARPESDLSDFVLCAEILRLFSKLDALRIGTIECVEVRAGIPRRIVYKPHPTIHQDSTMTIHRRYEADPGALERVVEILYRLLVESPSAPADGGESASAEVQEAPCVSTEPE